MRPPVVTQPAAWRAQGHPNVSGSSPPLAVGLSLLLSKGQPQKFSMAGLHEAVMRTTDGPVGRTTWKTPTGLLRAVVLNPIVPHSHRRAKKSFQKPAFTMNCRGIWARLGLVAGCQPGAGREGRDRSGKALRWGLDNLGNGEGKRVGVIHLHFLQELGFVQAKILTSFAGKEST